MSRKDKNAWLFVELQWDVPTLHLHFSSPGCRFKTTIALCLINSMYGDALAEKPD